MTSNLIIYGLVDPSTLLVRYVSLKKSASGPYSVATKCRRLGVAKSEETRRRMSDAAKALWARRREARTSC